MATNNIKLISPDSKLLQYTQIELKDPTDAYLESCFAAIQQNRYTIESNTLVQIGQTNKKSKDHISHALLYGILTDINNKAKCFQDLIALNGTNLSSIIGTLETLIMKNWRRIYDNVRQQLIWFLRETLAANIDGIDRLYYVFLRQINPHEQCLDLCETIIELLLIHPLFLKTYPEMKLLTIYTFLSIFPIYIRRKSQQQQRQIDFIINLTRENIHCLGRDGIRLLIQLGHVREIDAFLKHLSLNTSNDYLPKILSLETEPKYLALPLSFDLERHLQFLLDNCRINSQEKYYFEWFQSQYLNFKQHPDSIYLCSHIIRYVCVVCRNQLNPQKITRWTFISWLLTQLYNYQQTLHQTLISASQTAMNAAAFLSSSSPQLIQINEQIIQCRLAIYYDWFLFDINNLQQMTNEFDTQLNSTIVGYHLLTISYQQAKQMLLFLLYTSENLIVSLKSFLQQNIARLFMELFQRIPILNSQQLLQMFTHDRDTYQRLLTTFFSLPMSTTAISPDNDDIMIINDDISPNAAMPATDDEVPSDIMIMSSNTAATPRFSDDEDDDDDYENRLSSHKSLDQDYDDDDDVLMISDETKTSTDIYNTNIIRSNFPFDRFRSYINEHIQQLSLSYSASTNRNKSSLLIQICKQIASTLSDKRLLTFQTQAIDPAGPITSYAMIKFEKTSEKFQSRLLTIFDEQTIVNGLLCLWLLRDSFPNRLLPSLRISQTNKTNSMLENNFREIPQQKLKRSIKQLSICVLFRLIKDDIPNQDVYIKLIQSMYFFQPEIAYIFLYYLSIDIDDVKMAADIFEKFAKDIIKLSTDHRKTAMPPAKIPTYDQDFIDFILEILTHCEQDDTETFLYLFSYMYRLYSKKFLNNFKLIRLLLHTINQFELEQFMLDILKHRLQLFNSHKLYSIVDQTLLFSQIEQEDFWKLLGAHDFVQNDYEQLFTNIIEHLLNQSKSVIGEQRLAKSIHYTTYRNTIALANVYDILKTKIPTYGLICCLFAHELTKHFSEKLCLLWHEKHHDIFWRYLERILQKWIQRENDQTKQKIDYKIGTIKMANENGLKFILQHLQTLLENNSIHIQENKIDQDDLHDQLTIDENLMNIPLSVSTIKSLIDCIHKNEQLYMENKTFIDRLENGNSVVPPPLPTAPAAAATTTTTSASIKRRKLDNNKS
ncbi:unnamed protein product [Adineta steineri]|uniref:Uncharacterized protein n=1 Tax=Adineta steineri TaxID=433720 RepID=A0A819C4C3_9BILA|nr:unnamed protein product [Adineta steineri]CAF3808345.1 unnamed protein product [Adineta steineri]